VEKLRNRLEVRETEEHEEKATEAIVPLVQNNWLRHLHSPETLQARRNTDDKNKHSRRRPEGLARPKTKARGWNKDILHRLRKGDRGTTDKTGCVGKGILPVLQLMRRPIQPESRARTHALNERLVKPYRLHACPVRRYINV